MSDRNLIFTLAKVIIAAAWADGEISHEERNSLKDLLFQLPQIGLDKSMQLTGQEWQRLEMYMHDPIGDAERQRLLEELQVATRTPTDKKLVFEALDRMVLADGEVTEAETAVINQVKQAVNNYESGSFTVNVLPTSSSLVTDISPSWASTRLLTMASPRPVPTARCWCPLTRLYRSKMWGSSSTGIP